MSRRDEYVIDTIERDGGWRARILPDSDPINPRKDYDHVGTMVCDYRRYDLGDATLKEDLGFEPRFNSRKHLERYYRIHKHAAVFLWLSVYEHSGITMYIGTQDYTFDPGGWDSSIVGFIYCTREQAREGWGTEPTVIEGVSYTPLKMAERYLRGEVEEYDKYLTGDVAGYVIEMYTGTEDDYLEDVSNWLVVESCWGFLGSDYCKKEAEGVLDACIEQAQKEKGKIERMMAL